MEKDRERKTKMDGFTLFTNKQKKRSSENQLNAAITDLETSEDETEKETLFTANFEKAETKERERPSSSYTTVTVS